MKPVDSKQKMLDLTDIIISSNLAQNTGLQPQEAVLTTIFEMSIPTNKYMRIGNTLFIVSKGEGRNGYMSAMNMDTPRNFVENVRKFIDSMYLLGFDNLVTIFEQEELIQVFRIIAKNQPRADMGYEIGIDDEGKYVATFSLGPSREGDF